jgi:hypothetical protein
VDSKKYNDFFSTVPLSMDQRFTMI